MLQVIQSIMRRTQPQNFSGKYLSPSSFFHFEVVDQKIDRRNNCVKAAVTLGQLIKRTNVLLEATTKTVRPEKELY